MLGDGGSLDERLDPSKQDQVVAGRYRVERLIARGGTAAVYLARQLNLNRMVALKVMRPPGENAAVDFKDRFRLEAEILASLSHPNIVVIHDFGEIEDGRVFLAMEFVEGPRLTDLLKDGPLPHQEVVGLVMQVCNAVRYAHRRGVIHRDLKPSNLLIQASEDHDVLKVVDFGIVKLTEMDQTNTNPGVILGTPHCMAPEQVKGENVTERVDIYAIGVLLFRALTGVYPFHGVNSTATMLAHLNQPPPSFAAANPHLQLPVRLQDIAFRCLEKQPRDRYPDVSALMADLAAFQQDPDADAADPTMPAVPVRTTVVTPASVRRATPNERRTVLYMTVGASVAFMLLMTLVLGSLYFFGLPEFQGTPTGQQTPDAGTPVTDPNPVLRPTERPPAPTAELEPEPAAPQPTADDKEPVELAPVDPEPVAAPAPEPSPRPTPSTAPAPTSDGGGEYLGLPDDW